METKGTREANNKILRFHFQMVKHICQKLRIAILNQKHKSLISRDIYRIVFHNLMRVYALQKLEEKVYKIEGGIGRPRSNMY